MAGLLERQETWDVIVIGLGGHGSAALAHLAKSRASSGGKILGIEQFQTTHKEGSSHGYSRIYRQAYFEDPAYVPLLQRSLVLWKELQSHHEERSDKQSSRVITLCGSLMIGKPDSEVVVGTLKSVAEHSLPSERFSAAESRARFPAFHLEEEELALHERDAGYLNPELCIETYIAQAIEHGAQVHYEEKFLSFERVADSPGTLEVTTNKGKYLTKKLVLSVGAWAPDIYGKSVPFPLHIERRVLFWFKPVEGSSIDWTKLPVYIWELGAGVNFYGFPEDKETFPGAVKVAMHVLRVLDEKYRRSVAVPEDIDRTVHPEEVQAMRDVLSSHIPEMAGELLHTETCMYTMTPDEHFLIDFHPEYEDKNVVLVSPCSGHGFKFCSVVGEIVKDLVENGETGHDIRMFRINARASSK